MKAVLALAVLAVIATITDSSAIDTSARANLNVGSIGAGDRLFYMTYISKGAIANSVQSQDVIYRGNVTTRISAIQAVEVGGTQWASARIIAGGLGHNNVTVRFTSARGRGYAYQLSIWGR